MTVMTVKRLSDSTNPLNCFEMESVPATTGVCPILSAQLEIERVYRFAVFQAILADLGVDHHIYGFQKSDK